MKALLKNWIYRFWMSFFSRLNSISIMPILDGSAELKYNLFCSECNQNIMKKSFVDLNEIIFYFCYVVDLHYGIYGTINAGNRCFSSSIFDPEVDDCIKETFSVEKLGVIAYRGLNLKENEYYKNGKKALELINAYKFYKMTQSECGKSCWNWVEAFFQNLSSPALSKKLEDCTKMILKLVLNQVNPFVIE